MPIVTIAPNYPRKAAIAGIEGWVKIQFIVTKQGAVKDAQVIDSHPKRIFDNEAVRALLRYKFKPWRENGEVVEHQMTQIINFKLAK